MQIGLTNNKKIHLKHVPGIIIAPVSISLSLLLAFNVTDWTSFLSSATLRVSKEDLDDWKNIESGIFPAGKSLTSSAIAVTSMSLRIELKSKTWNDK